jgi:hypothetical protein
MESINALFYSSGSLYDYINYFIRSYFCCISESCGRLCVFGWHAFFPFKIKLL